NRDWAVFHSSADADDHPPASAGGTDKARTIAPSLTVGLLVRSRCALNADRDVRAPGTKLVPSARGTHLNADEGVRAPSARPVKNLTWLGGCYRSALICQVCIQRKYGHHEKSSDALCSASLLFLRP